MPTIAGYKTGRKLFESHTTVVFGARHPVTNQAVMLKLLKGEHPENERRSRFRKEYSLLSSFDSSLIIKTYGLEKHVNSLVIVLEDCQGRFVPLRDMIADSPFDLEQLLRTAVEITRGLEIVHHSRVVYRRLTPAGILISKDARHIKLVDFSLATGEDALEREQRSVIAPNDILPYISPEQTGRIDQAVDHRTDFYSLGVILFQLATGELPFAAASPGAIIHAHLAQVPPPPDRLNGAIAPAVSAIILKLLEKSPARRYQTCRGILGDLEHCLQKLREQGAITAFSPGRHDIACSLELPSHLYSREHELRLLRTGLERAAAGGVETVYISGPTGVGKSSLVQAFRDSLGRGEAYFLHGRFEAFGTGPYAAIAWTMRQLVRLVLSENSSSISRTRTHIRQAVSGEGAVLTAVFPELEQLLDPLEETTGRNPGEDEGRFFRAFAQFLQACCQSGPPLILFLDDLHHADPASLRLLGNILCCSRLCRLLFIGTCREPAGDRDSLLQHLLAANRKVHHLVLGNLHLPDIAHLLSQALRREGKELWELANHCFQKTGGNPYYLRQFLQAANHAGFLIYSAGKERWEWEPAAIRKSSLTSNAAEMVVRELSSLPASTSEFLKVAACLGDSCSLKLASAVLGYLPENELEQAVRLGFMLPSTGNAITAAAAPNGHCLFAHARIKDAVLALPQPDELAAIRLKAGRHLLYTLEQEEFTARLEEVAQHLNSGLDQIISRTERLEVARLNLDAGRQAKSMEKNRTAHCYFVAGVHALPEKSWQTDYPLALELHIEACAASLICGEYGDMEEYFQAVYAKATDIHDTCRVYRLRIRAFKAQGQPDRALSACLEILSLLGVKIPAQPSRIRCLSSLLLTRLRLMGVSSTGLLAQPKLTDRKILAVMGFLLDTSSAAYSAAPRLLPFLSDHAIRLSRRYGNNLESSIIGYLVYGFLLCSLSGRFINLGHRFGQLALQLRKQLNSGQDVCQSSYGYNSFIGHWKEHIRNTLPPLKLTLEGFVGRDDLDSTANAACSITLRHYLIGTNLNRISAEFVENLELVRRLDQRHALTRMEIFRQAVANLRDEAPDPVVLKGQYYNEEETLPAYLAAKDYTSYCIAAIIKMIHAVLFNEYRQAMRLSDEVGGYLASLAASVFLPVYYFYDSLARLADYHRQNSAEKLRTRLKVRRNQRKMQRWAQHAPENYGHKYSLVEAERERVRERNERAMELYDKAIQLAHDHEYIQEEGLAYELAARFYDGRGKPHIARYYLREARYCYYRWGAAAKVRRLDSQDGTVPVAAQGSGPAISWTTPLTTTLTPGEGASRLDMLTVIKASRILSGEMVLDELLKKMMRIMLESGGAQRGSLIFRENGEWVIKVSGAVDTQSVVTLTSIPVSSQEIASTAIINYVANAVKDVVLDDACREGIFAGDGYILEKKPRSVLCMPIIHQGKTFCILYLENNLATGTFPPDRQELLHLLGTQAAISLKNASLFEELEETVGQLNAESEKRRATQRQLLHAEKLSALGRLSASIAHEFGNPLMGVKYLLDDFHKRDGVSAGDRQLLELGLEECDRMKKLIRDLQRLNKPSSGKMIRTNIHPLIEHVLLFQKKHFSSNRISLQTQFNRSLPELEVIADQIAQVLFNLTMNAVDAMAEDGGSLTVATRQDDGALVIEITDTGTGIPYENQEQIFEPFFSTKKEEDGTGLGLSISYGIARHHGGRLSFVSTPGEGTTFSLSLPLTAAILDGTDAEPMKN